MAHQKYNTQESNESQVSLEPMLRAPLQHAARTVLVSALEAEVGAFISALRYQSSAER